MSLQADIQTYRDFNLDVFRSKRYDVWYCEFWSRSDHGVEGSIRDSSRRKAVERAKARIDRYHRKVNNSQQ